MENREQENEITNRREGQRKVQNLHKDKSSALLLDIQHPDRRWLHPNYSRITAWEPPQAMFSIHPMNPQQQHRRSQACHWSFCHGLTFLLSFVQRHCSANVARPLWSVDNTTRTGSVSSAPRFSRLPQ